MNLRSTEESPGTWSSLSQHPLWATELWRWEHFFPHCAYDNSLTSLKSSVIFQSPSPGDSCHNSSLFPNPHLSHHLPPGLPSHPRGLFSFPFSPGHRASVYTLTPFVASHATPTLPQRIHSGPCLLPAFCRPPLSCPDTWVCHKVLVKAALKISLGFRENPDPVQESRALPSGLGGKVVGL